MKALGVLLLALAMTGCVPIIYPARYEKPSRQNLTDTVPAFIETGRTTMADVVLALGDPDTVAADESWIAYASAYREGGGGAVLVLAGGGQVGLLGGARKQMLYRRLLVRFDAVGIVLAATLDVVKCGNNEYFLGQDVGSAPPCFDVDSRDIAAAELTTRLLAQGETNVVVFNQAEWLATHERGMVAISDTAIHFVPAVDGRWSGSAGAKVALADLTDAQPAPKVFGLFHEGRPRVILRRGEMEVAAFVVRVADVDDAAQTAEALELVQQRIAVMLHGNTAGRRDIPE